MPGDTKQDIKACLEQASRIVILQADNPDGDSIGSALALEQILSDMGKEPYLYCGVDIPSYLRHLPGWDRISKEIPKNFDLSIIVDTSAISLFGALQSSGQMSWIRKRPCIVLDHHDVESTIPFATIMLNEPAVATAEIIYELAQGLSWPLNTTASNMIATAILSDSLGLTSEATTARSIHIIAELVEKGVNLSALDSARRMMSRKSPEITRYKGQLLQRVELFDNDRIVLIHIPWNEIQQYSHAYNPSMLVIDDMRQIENAAIAIAFKSYPDGKVTAKLRANLGYGVAGELAKHFGGGGHAYASGFKVTDKPLDEVKSECIIKATELLNDIEKENGTEST